MAAKGVRTMRRRVADAAAVSDVAVAAGGGWAPTRELHLSAFACRQKTLHNCIFVIKASDAQDSGNKNATKWLPARTMYVSMPIFVFTN
jgi:hypothetical protein